MSELIQYKNLESGIHYFLWLQSDVIATKQYIQIYNNILKDAQAVTDKQSMTLRFILDLSQASLPPLDEMVAESVEHRRRIEIGGNRIITHFAYLSDDDSLRKKIENIAPIMSTTNQRQIFSTNQKQQAIDWLLSL